MQAADLAQRLLIAVAQPFQVEPYELNTTLSVGIAMYPADGDSFDTLYQRADAAMYRAKQSGRNRFGFFTADLEARTSRALQIENALLRALERNQFELHYQPQVSLATRQVVGAEALLRWKHPELGMVSPAEFIPVAESSGMIVAIGEWVLNTAVHDAKRWLDLQLPLRAVSVNLSAIQFRQPQLPELVSRVLVEFDLPPDSLELELTEGVAVDDPHAAVATMDQLHARGVRMSMDGLWHRLLVTQPAQAVPDLQAEDRSILCARPGQRQQRPRHRQRHHPHGAGLGHADDCRRGGNGWPAGVSARAGLR